MYYFRGKIINITIMSLIGIGAIISAAAAAASAASSVGTSVRQGRKAKEGILAKKGVLKAAKQRNEDWYNRRYNEDPTQQAAAQRVLTATEQAIRQRNRAAEGKAALMGGTDESVEAARATNAAAYADTASRIAAEGQKRKDQIEEQYLERASDIDKDLVGIDTTNGTEVGKGISAAFGAAGSIANAALSIPNKDVETNTAGATETNTDTGAAKSFKDKYGYEPVAAWQK